MPWKRGNTLLSKISSFYAYVLLCLRHCTDSTKKHQDTVWNMLKVNNKGIRTTSLTWRRIAVLIVNFEHISHLFLVFLLVLMSKQLFAEVVLFSVVFFTEGEDSPQKFLFSQNCITHFVVLRMLRSSRSYLFYKRSAIQNLQKTTCAGVFLIKLDLQL